MDKQSAIKLMRKKRKLFPWLKSFCSRYTGKLFSDDSNEVFKFLLLNIDKEVKNLGLEMNKQRAENLFDLLNTLVLHFVWQIRWKTSRIWKTYWKKIKNEKMGANKQQQYCCAKIFQYLIVLAMYLTESYLEGCWINRILTTLKIFPDALDVTYDALLFVNDLKKKYCPIYRVILKNVLCNRVGGNLSDPIIYSKEILLFRRLLKFTEDDKEKSDILRLASKLEPPANVISWFSTQNIGILDSIECNNLSQRLLLRPYPDEFLRKLTQAVVKEELTGWKTIQNSQDQVTYQNFNADIFYLDDSLRNSEGNHKDEFKNLHTSDFCLKAEFPNYQGAIDAIINETFAEKKTEKYFYAFNCKKKKTALNDDFSSSLLSEKIVCDEENLEKNVGLTKKEKKLNEYSPLIKNLKEKRKHHFKMTIENEDGEVNADYEPDSNNFLDRSLGEVNSSLNDYQHTVKQEQYFVMKHEKKKKSKNISEGETESENISKETMLVNLQNGEHSSPEFPDEIDSNEKHSQKVFNSIEENLPCKIINNLQNCVVLNNKSSMEIDPAENLVVLDSAKNSIQDNSLKKKTKKKKSKHSKLKKKHKTKDRDVASLSNNLLKYNDETDTSAKQIVLINENCMKKRKHSKKSKKSKKEHSNKVFKNTEEISSAHFSHHEYLDCASFLEKQSGTEKNSAQLGEKNKVSKKNKSKRMKISEHLDEQFSDEINVTKRESESSSFSNVLPKKKRLKKHSLKRIEGKHDSYCISDTALLPNLKNFESQDELSSNVLSGNEIVLNHESSLKKRKKKKKSKKHSKEKINKERKTRKISDKDSSEKVLHQDEQSIKLDNIDSNSDLKVSGNSSDIFENTHSKAQKYSKKCMKKLYNPETFKMNEKPFENASKLCASHILKSNAEVSDSKNDENEQDIFRNKKLKLYTESNCSTIESETSEMNSQFSSESNMSGFEEVASQSDVSICELLKLPKIKYCRSYKALGIKKDEMLNSKKHKKTQEVLKNKSSDEENTSSANELLLASKEILKQSQICDPHNSQSLFDDELAIQEIKTLGSNNPNEISACNEIEDISDSLKSNPELSENLSLSSSCDVASLSIKKELSLEQNTTESKNEKLNSDSFFNTDSEYDENTYSMSIHDPLSLDIHEELCSESKTSDINFSNNIKMASNTNLSEFKINRRSSLRFSYDSPFRFSLPNEAADFISEQADESKFECNNKMSSTTLPTPTINKSMNEYQESVFESIAQSENSGTSSIECTSNDNESFITESLPTSSFNSLVLETSESNQLQQFSVIENHYNQSHSVTSRVLPSSVTETETSGKNYNYNSGSSAENNSKIESETNNIDSKDVGTSTECDNSVHLKFECKISGGNPETNQQHMKNISSIQVIVNFKNEDDGSKTDLNAGLNISNVQTSLNLFRPPLPNNVFYNCATPYSFAINNLPTSHFSGPPIFQNQTPYSLNHSSFCNSIPYGAPSGSDLNNSCDNLSSVKKETVKINYRDVSASPVESSQSSNSSDACSKETLCTVPMNSSNILFRPYKSHDNEFSKYETSNNNLMLNNSHSVLPMKSCGKALGTINIKDSPQFESSENSQTQLLLKPLTEANIAAINEESRNFSSSQSSNVGTSYKTGTDIYSDESSDDLSVSTMTLLSDFEAELSVAENLEIGKSLQSSKKKPSQVSSGCHKFESFRQTNLSIRNSQPAKLGKKKIFSQSKEHDSGIDESSHKEKDLHSSTNKENSEKSQATKNTRYNLRARTSLQKPKTYDSYI